MREFSDTIPVMPKRTPMPYRPRIVACNADACNQGREPCPCPDACQTANAPDGGAYVIAWGALLLVLACIGIALWLASWLGG